MKKRKPVFEEKHRYVAGIDIASRADHFVCGPRLDNGDYEIVSFGTTTPKLYEMLEWLQKRNVKSVAMESTSVFWIPVADLLEMNGIEVVLVDTRVVRMIPGRKSDIEDCQWLQKLHSSGLLRGAFRPNEKITAVRSVLREKDTFVSMRTQAIQQIQKSLDQMNIRVHHAVSDITGKTGTAIIKAIIDGERDPIKLAKLRDMRCQKSEKEIADHLTGTWRDEHLFNLGRSFSTLQFLDDMIKEYDNKVAIMLQSLAEDFGTKTDDNSSDTNHPLPLQKVNKSDKARIIDTISLHKIMGFDLTSIPGIGFNIASIITSEIGTSFDRFPTEHHFASYIGLAPSLCKSAGKSARQKQCKNTSRVGLVLRMAACSLCRSQTELGAYLRSIARRKDMKTAIKATARRMAHLIYRGIKYGKEYIDIGVEAYQTRMKEKTVKTINRLIKSHGINKLDIDFGDVCNLSC